MGSPGSFEFSLSSSIQSGPRLHDLNKLTLACEPVSSLSFTPTPRKMPPRLIEVIGSLNIDLISVTDRVPGPGETIACKSSSTGFGGKGANQAVAAARLSKPNPNGHSVRMIGAVGKDQFGDDFLRHLDHEGIDRSAVIVKEGKTTGTATIIVETNGQNRILFSMGANGEVKPADMKLADTDSIVVFQHEIPKQSVWLLVSLYSCYPPYRLHTRPLTLV